MTNDTRKGDWLQTISGLRFYPADPRPEDITITDIAHALSHICRFNGHVKRFYSVAEHSVLVSMVVPPEDALQGLLHDATEAYLGDVTRPLKRQLSNYADFEERAWLAISERFNVPVHMAASVKRADNDVLLAERDALLMNNPQSWSVQGTPAPVNIVGLHPSGAREMFLNRFSELTGLSVWSLA